ncbi:MAG: hypothetical protein OXU20_16860 [Myxococcales bacterium]|nr:hypothetical protein [Myxococcales bacterium]MDD9965649.1 hypothetical protein [Myxococcales bacterium]
MLRTAGVVLGLLLAPGLCWAQAQPTVDLTRSVALAPLAGQMSTPAWYQNDIGFWGTDMGFLFEHQGVLWILFGDTAKDASGAHIEAPVGQAPADDALGAICLEPSVQCPAFVPWFSSGADVDAYVAANPPGPGELSWQREGPPVLFHTYEEGGDTKVLPIQVINRNVTPRAMIVPIPGPGFSNYKLGSEAGAFATFNGPAARCDWGCPDGFDCDPALGVEDHGFLSADDGGYVQCILGAPGCHDVGGLCTDPSSPFPGAVARRFEIGNADIPPVGPATPSRFITQSWVTHKISNPAMTTVDDFSRFRSIYWPGANDYGPPDGLPSSRQKVFMWGRGGVSFDGKAWTYFAYADMPSYSPDGDFEWEPQYYTGTSPGGFPQFSPREVDAAPLIMNTIGPPSPDEPWLAVNMISVRYIEALGKWVMLYGGGTQEALPPGPGVDPQNAVKVRFADHPWGPWSEPQQFFVSGDPTVPPSGSVPDTQFGQGGVLAHKDCTMFGDDCAPRESWWSLDFGFLYGVNIIQQWTMPRLFPEPGVDLYWTASTFDPYQVVLFRTRVNLP